MTARTLVLGDRHPWLRDPELLRALLVAGIAVVTFAFGVAVGGLWQSFGYVSGSWLGSTLQIDNADLIADSLGAATGAARWGRGSVRRIPGENRNGATEAGPD